MEFKKNQSIYLQIADLICENILQGNLKEGERIPSVREYAGEVQVNPNTIMRTYAHLQELGIVENKRGIGLFVASGATRKIHLLQKDLFITQELPAIFRKMKLLQVSFPEIKKIYDREFNVK